jgi:hypothetical protein
LTLLLTGCKVVDIRKSATKGNEMKPSEMTKAQFEAYADKLWASAKPLGYYVPEPVGPDREPWNGLAEGEQ